MITYNKSNFIYFALNFGLWHCPKIVLRMLYRKIFERGNNVIVLAKSQTGQIVACGMGRPLNKKYLFPVRDSYLIGPVFVLPQERQKGVGYELVRTIIDSLGGHNVFYAYMHVQNKKSIRTFEKSNFRTIGYIEKKEEKYCLVERATTLVLMEKQADNNQEG